MATSISSILLLLMISLSRVNSQGVCQNNPCINGGTCIGRQNQISCECVPGFSGERCQFASCTPNPCLNEGTCVRTALSYDCFCTMDYTGPRCRDIIPRSCDPNPCGNGGTCVGLGNGIRCHCHQNYRGARCEIMTQEPRCNSNPCRNGGTCLETHTGYGCYCGPNHFGRLCESTRRTGTVCSNNFAECEAWAASGACTSMAGREFMTRECRPACRLCTIRGTPCPEGHCLNAAICVENGGEFECLCREGFSGSRCERPTTPIASCTPNPCNTGRCIINARQERECICPDGVVGLNCLTDMCQPNPCNTGICVGIQGGFYCRCPSSASGRRCEIGCRDEYVRITGESMFRAFQANVEQCQQECDSQPGCMGFDHEGETSSCYLIFDPNSRTRTTRFDHYERRRCTSSSGPLIEEPTPLPLIAAIDAGTGDSENEVKKDCKVRYKKTPDKMAMIPNRKTLNLTLEECKKNCTANFKCLSFDFTLDCLPIESDVKWLLTASGDHYDKLPCSPSENRDPPGSTTGSTPTASTRGPTHSTSTSQPTIYP